MNLVQLHWLSSGKLQIGLVWWFERPETGGFLRMKTIFIVIVYISLNSVTTAIRERLYSYTYGVPRHRSIRRK